MTFWPSDLRDMIEAEMSQTKKLLAPIILDRRQALYVSCVLLLYRSEADLYRITEHYVITSCHLRLSLSLFTWHLVPIGTWHLALGILDHLAFGFHLLLIPIMFPVPTNQSTRINQFFIETILESSRL